MVCGTHLSLNIAGGQQLFQGIDISNVIHNFEVTAHVHADTTHITSVV